MGRRRIAAGMLIGLFVFFLLGFAAGCDKRAAEFKDGVTINVAFWGDPEEVKIITDIIEKWEIRHPDIKVKLEHTPYSGYISKILTRIVGGTAPDVICTEANLFVSFCTKDVFLNLNPFIEKDKDFDLGNFFPEVISRFIVDGKTFGIPRDTAPFACVYYNKKLFDKDGIPYPKDGWDWNDLLEKAERLTKVKDGQVTQYGFYGWAWQNFVYSNGGSIVDNVKNPTRCTLGEPASIEGLQFYADLINKYKVAPAVTALINLGMGAQQLFMTERLAMFSSGIWETPILRKIKDFEWDVAMFPKGPKGIRGFGTGGSAYCILKTTKHPQEAWEVIKALSGEEAQIMLAKTGLAQPANRLIAEGPNWAGSLDKPPANKGMLNEAVKYVIYEPFHPQWREIQELYIIPEFDLLFNGNKTAQEVVSKIVPEINKMLSERK